MYFGALKALKSYYLSVAVHLLISTIGRVDSHDVSELYDMCILTHFLFYWSCLSDRLKIILSFMSHNGGTLRESIKFVLQSFISSPSGSRGNGHFRCH